VRVQDVKIHVLQISKRMPLVEVRCGAAVPKRNRMLIHVLHKWHKCHQPARDAELNRTYHSSIAGSVHSPAEATAAKMARLASLRIIS